MFTLQVITYKSMFKTEFHYNHAQSLFVNILQTYHSIKLVLKDIIINPNIKLSKLSELYCLCVHLNYRYTSSSLNLYYCKKLLNEKLIEH